MSKLEVMIPNKILKVEIVSDDSQQVETSTILPLNFLWEDHSDISEWKLQSYLKMKMFEKNK